MAEAQTRAGSDGVQRRPARPGWRAVAFPLLLALAGAVMATWTWGTWLDVVVDYGRELYVPWRLTEGDVLFRDLAWFNGPLSPYWNALWFSILGTSVRTLTLVNLALLAGVTALCFHLLAIASDRLAAFVACLIFLLLFAFVQYLPNGSYNWVAPYSHEATHGLFLGLGALAALEAWGGVGRRAWLGVSGALLGLAFLTKASVFLAGAAGSGVALVLLLSTVPEARARAVRHLGLFAVCFSAPGALAFLLLASAMPAADALGGVLGSWPAVLSGEVAGLPFYQEMIGLSEPAESAARLVSAAALLALLLLPAAALAGLRRRSPKISEGMLAAATFLAVASFLWWLRSQVPWNDITRPLPLLLLALSLPLARSALRESADRHRAIFGLAFAALSFVLLGRMLFAASIERYGFTLAAPATMLCVVAGVGWVPAWLAQRGGRGSVFRAAVLALLAIVTLGYVEFAASFLARQTLVVGTGADAFRADARGRSVRDALAAVQAGVPRGGTLAVLPEGVMLNYLSRVRAPGRFINYMPPEIVMFGTESMTAALAARPPDRVLLVHKDTAEYGVRFFGRDYGQGILSWVDAYYERIDLFGKEPLTPGKGFGIAVLAPRSSGVGR